MRIKDLMSFFNKKPCCVCGEVLRTIYSKGAICKELANDWDLSTTDWQVFNLKEGELCKKCGSSLRIRIFIDAFLNVVNKVLDTKYISLNCLVKDEHFRNLIIAEINGCSNINKFLLPNQNVYYSEYGSLRPDVRHEDLMCLTYDSNLFDFVINTEVLEHIPEYCQALKETYRVLKNGGYYIFTVPIIFGRKTRQRAAIFDSDLRYLLPKSYHGPYQDKKDDRLVFWEFGDDFVSDLKKIFDNVEIFMPNTNAHRSLCAFICKK